MSRTRAAPPTVGPAAAPPTVGPATLAAGSSRAWTVVVVLAALAGAAVRIWMLAGPRGQLDSDEATVGLMARHMLDGDFTAFYWSQHYGGTIETGLAAVVFALVGASVLSLKAVPLLLDVVAVVLLWRLARRLLGPRAGAFAALAFWVWPAAFVWWSARERGFYWSGLVIGLVVLLLAARLADEGGSPGLWSGLGLAAGLGWWTTPNIVYFLLPAGIWLALAGRRAWRSWAVVVPAAALGALPWLWHNLEQGWASLDPPPQPVDQGYLGHLWTFVSGALPMALNLRLTFSERWVGGWVGIAAYVAVTLLAARALSRPGRSGLLVLMVVSFPFLYAVFPAAWFVGEGRYALFAAPWLAMVIALICRPLLHRPVAAGAALAALAGLSVYGISQVGIGPPVRVDDDIAQLEAAGIRYVWGDYWYTARITFESDERIIGSTSTYYRHKPFADAVLASGRPGFLFVEGTAPERRFLQATRALGAVVEGVRTDDFVVYVPDRPLRPADLPPAARP